MLFVDFSGNYGRCLLNKPRKNELDWFKSASQYPGQHFDENRLQKHQQFPESLAILQIKHKYCLNRNRIAFQYDLS